MSRVLDQDAKACAQQLKQACFDGDFRGFDRALSDYRMAHSQADPHARAVFEALINEAPTNQLLAWRSHSTSQFEWQQQLGRRWDAWLAVLPLDLQLYLLRMESDPRTFHCINLDAIKWDQWEALGRMTKHSNQSQSPLWPRRPQHQDRDKIDHLLHQVSRDVAGQLIAWKQYEALDPWMRRAGISPLDPIDKLYVYYEGPSMRGSTFATAQAPLPFWAVGLYAGAVEDAYWQVLARLGGPMAPVVNEAGLAAPLARIQPHAKLAIEAIAQVERTAAQWQQRALEADTRDVVGKRPAVRL